MIIGTNVGGGSASGPITIPGAPTGFGNPIVFASINIAATYWIAVNATGPNTFNYSKTYWSGSGVNAASVETFNYVAYWL